MADPTQQAAEALGAALAAIEEAAEAIGVEPVRPDTGPSMNDAIRAKTGHGAPDTGKQAA